MSDRTHETASTSSCNSGSACSSSSCSCIRICLISRVRSMNHARRAAGRRSGSWAGVCAFAAAARPSDTRDRRARHASRPRRSSVRAAGAASAGAADRPDRAAAARPLRRAPQPRATSPASQRARDPTRRRRRPNSGRAGPHRARTASSRAWRSVATSRRRGRTVGSGACGRRARRRRCVLSVGGARRNAPADRTARSCRIVLPVYDRLLGRWAISDVV